MAADVHALAVAAYDATEKLATALGAEGASEDVLSNVTKCGELFKQITEALGRGQEETGDNEPAGPGSLDQAAAETHSAMQQAAAKRNA